MGLGWLIDEKTPAREITGVIMIEELKPLEQKYKMETLTTSKDRLFTIIESLFDKVIRIAPYIEVNEDFFINLEEDEKEKTIIITNKAKIHDFYKKGKPYTIFIYKNKKDYVRGEKVFVCKNSFFSASEISEKKQEKILISVGIEMCYFIERQKISAQ